MPDNTEPSGPVPTVQEQVKQFTALTDDMTRLRESIPERKRDAYEREVRLRRIIAVLRHTGYTQPQINEIFSTHAGKELFDDIAEQHKVLGLPAVDTSDIDLS